jgi:hypothetical protein
MTAKKNQKSQVLPLDYPINPATTSGVDLANILNRTFNTMMSNNAGLDRPLNIERGGLWSQLDVAGDVILYMFDGVTDVEIGKLAGGTFTPPNNIDVSALVQKSGDTMTGALTNQVSVTTPIVNGNSTLSLQTNSLPAINIDTGQIVSFPKDIIVKSISIGTGNSTDSTIVGEGAGANLQPAGTGNVFVGYGAGFSTQNGNVNNALGTNALRKNVDGAGNCAFGGNALGELQSGSLNVAIGNSVLQNNTADSNNTVVGQSAFENLTNGGANTAIGKGAGNQQSSGIGNTYLGFGAGSAVVSGNYNVIIGGSGGLLEGGTSGQDNTIVISDGEGTRRMAFNSVGTPYFFQLPVSSGITTTVRFNPADSTMGYDGSSKNFKENIVNCPYGLNEVLKLQSKKFKYKNSNANDVGFIAEEMIQVIPEVVGLAQNVKDSTGIEDGQPLFINYDRLTSVLVKAVQEQQSMIEALQARITALETK